MNTKTLPVNDIKIRPICERDVNNWLSLLLTLEGESNYLLFEKGERKSNLEECMQYVRNIREEKNKSMILLAESTAGDLVGQAHGDVSSIRKKSHTMVLSVGVIQSYKGLGRLLVNKMIEHSKIKNIKRVECTIMENNTLSFNLAKKCGFKVEGKKNKSIKIGTEYVDEIVLGLINE